MRVLHIRFTIGSMMGGVAILAILSWLVNGFGQHGRRFFWPPPLYLVVAFLSLLSIATTFVVTFLQIRQGATEMDQSGAVEQNLLAAGVASSHGAWARESTLKIGVLAIAGSLALLSVSAGAIGFFLPALTTHDGRPAILTMISDPSDAGALSSESNTPESTSHPTGEAANEDIAVQRASLRTPDTASLPFPPLPTRFSPGPLLEPSQNTAADTRHVPPVPPVPSKAPPGNVIEANRRDSDVIDPTEPVQPD